MHPDPSEFDPARHPHRRRNPLTGDWVLVSPQRALRPWQGAEEASPQQRAPAHDAGCYLCAGNLRVGGQRNPDYRGPFVFTNDFPALQPDGLSAAAADGAGGDGGDGAAGLLRTVAAAGTSRVVCFSEDHGATLPDLPLPAVRAVVDAWCAQMEELGRRWRWVQVFENKGAAMGCSNPHPHGQIWATDYLPNEAVREDRQQRAYHAATGRVLLQDVAALEAAAGERVVERGDGWLAVVPHWAVWPFETLLLPLFPVQRLSQLDAARRDDLAGVLQRLTRRYDHLFGCSFPYSMGWHGAPFDDADPTPWQLHAHFYPPLLRSASVRKFMVGFELLAEAQRDLTPEQAAERLRAAPGDRPLAAAAPLPPAGAPAA